MQGIPPRSLVDEKGKVVDPTFQYLLFHGSVPSSVEISSCRRRKMQEVGNRLTARGKPIHIQGDYEASCPDAWLHYDYVAGHVDVGAVGLDGWERSMFAVIPEPGNPYDSNAVAVSLHNRYVGYLPDDVAEKYAPILVAHIDKALSRSSAAEYIYALDTPGKDYPEPKK